MRIIPNLMIAMMKIMNRFQFSDIKICVNTIFELIMITDDLGCTKIILNRENNNLFLVLTLYYLLADSD